MNSRESAAIKKPETSPTPDFFVYQDESKKNNIYRMVFVTLEPDQRDEAILALSTLHNEVQNKVKDGRWFHASKDSDSIRMKLLKTLKNLQLHATIISEDFDSNGREGDRREKCFTKWAETLDTQKHYDLSLDREDSREKYDRAVLVNLRNSLDLSLKFKHDKGSDRTQLIALPDFIAWTYSAPKPKEGKWRDKIEKAVDIKVL